jgi:hypothetical protein
MGLPAVVRSVVAVVVAVGMFFAYTRMAQLPPLLWVAVPLALLLEARALLRTVLLAAAL